MKTVLVLTFATGLTAAFLRAAELPNARVLTLAAAKEVAAAARAFAEKNQWAVNIAIVDAAGNLVYFERGDGVQIPSVEIAIRKARCAAIYRRPTRAFQERAAKGEPYVIALPDVIPFEGGVPLVIGGEVVGGIGVSGATAQQDGMVAEAGAKALGR